MRRGAILILCFTEAESSLKITSFISGIPHYFRVLPVLPFLNFLHGGYAQK
jgi:hypothetical protein